MFDGAIGVDASNESIVLIDLDDGHRLVEIGVDAFRHRRSIVVGAPRRLSTTQAAFDALLLGTLEVEHEHEIHLALHLLRPALEIVLVAREAVDEKIARRYVFGLVARAARRRQLDHMLEHGILQQRARYLHWYNCTVANVLVDQRAILRAGSVLLLPQKVTGREVDKAKFLR